MSYIITYVPPPSDMSSLSYALLPPLNPSILAQRRFILTDPERALVREQRTKFLLFIKILFRELRTTRNFFLLAKSKLLVTAIVRQNRSGDPHSALLLESVERRLRALVGENHWRRAHILMRHYIVKRRGEVISTQQGRGVGKGEEQQSIDST